MAGHSHHPVPRAEQPMHAGALPAQPSIAEVEQEKPEVVSIPVRHDGPVTAHRLPARDASTQTLNVPVSPVTSAVFKNDFRRSRTVICSVDNPFYYATTRSGLSSTSVSAAAVWPPNVPLELENCDSVYLACAPVGTFSAATSSTIGIVAEFFAE
jgi:hypothetical protein